MRTCKHGVFYFCVVIVVLVPPSIADEPTDFLVTKHTPTVITCTASGVPFPSIHWMKNGIRLLPRGDGYRIQSSGKTQSSACMSVDWFNDEWIASSGFFFHQHKRLKYICISGPRQLGKNAIRMGWGIEEKKCLETK